MFVYFEFEIGKRTGSFRARPYSYCHNITPQNNIVNRIFFKLFPFCQSAAPAAVLPAGRGRCEKSVKNYHFRRKKFAKTVFMVYSNVIFNQTSSYPTPFSQQESHPMKNSLFDLEDRVIVVTGAAGVLFPLFPHLFPMK